MEHEGREGDEELLTLDEAVQFLGTSKPTLYRLLSQGDLKGLKVGRQWRFRRSDLVTYMERGEDTEIVQMAYDLCRRALEEKASDIHLEPRRDDVLVRNRVDGVLREAGTIPKDKQQALTTRFKVMAELDVSERRLPQDGRVPVRHDDKDYDFRVATVPSVYGEAITVRILDNAGRVLGLDNLGLAPEDRAKIESLMHQPNGVLLAAGPVGSGKTTLLYSCLQSVADGEKKTITIEDPVEAYLPYTTQIRVNRNVGLTLAAGMRAIMRQDPDVILLDRITDLETARLAMEASLTGHLLLASVTQDDSFAALAYLEELGIEPHLVAAAAIGVIGVRLCRRICMHCKTGYAASADDLRRFGFTPEGEVETVTLYRGAGCEQCRWRGYRGRIGLFEVLVMDERIANLTVSDASPEEIRAAALAAGMTDLRRDALRKVLAGETTPDEAMRVLFTTV